jgi:FxLD family lantipeptide
LKGRLAEINYPQRQEGPAMTTETLERPVAASTAHFDLDVRIVTAGPVTAALLSSTDDGVRHRQGQQLLKGACGRLRRDGSPERTTIFNDSRWGRTGRRQGEGTAAYAVVPAR